MRPKPTRREFLQSSAVSTLAGATGLPACSPSPDTSGQPEVATRSMLDFERSFFGRTSKPYIPDPDYVHDGGMVQGGGSIRDTRKTYESKCDITNLDTGHVKELFLFQPCRAEYTIAKRDLFQLPSREYRVVHSRTHNIPIAKRPSMESGDRKVRLLGFKSARFTTRTYPDFTVLTSANEVIEATQSPKPLNARTAFQNEAEGYRFSIEFPIRTISLNLEEDLFQVNTGPVPLPDMKTWDGERPSRVFLAFVAFSGLDFAEFILRREIEPSEEEKQWFHQRRGKWRWELREPENPPPGHPPRPP